jgi:tetratricopeptide (TPR) repeat protein
VAVGDLGAIAQGLNCLASIAHRRGQLVEAERQFQDAAVVAERAGERRLIGMIQQNLGVLASIRGDWDAALASYRLSLAAFDAFEDEEAASWVLNNVGKLHGDRGELPLAEMAFSRAIAIARRRSDLLVECVVQQNRAELLLVQGNVDGARKACTRSLDLAIMRGDHLRHAEGLKLRAKLEREEKEFDRAIATLEEARSLADPTEDALLAAELLCEIGEVWRMRGERAVAGAVWSEALAAFTRLGAKPAASNAGLRLRAIERIGGEADTSV